MEHVITKHILNHLESNSLLYDLQHSFKHSRSCETQLLSFVEELAANSDKNIQTNLIIMDFAKAFDKAPHQRLLYKLKFYGIKHYTGSLPFHQTVHKHWFWMESHQILLRSLLVSLSEQFWVLFFFWYI